MKQLYRFSIMLLALLLPALATAHDFEVDGIYYKINGNEATVTFRGYNCSSFYNEYSGPVVIPAAVTYNGTTYPVTSIDALAFIYCEGLTSIVIPNSVTEIGQEAFAYCPGLTSIVVKSGNPRYDSRNNCNAVIETTDNELIAGCKNTIIPNSVTKVGNFAFKGCESLTSIVIPNSVTEIGDRAFYSCNGLTSVNIGNSVTEIGDWAFEGCTGLTSVVVGSGNPRFDSRNNCNAIIETASNTLICGCKNSTIPNSVTAIGNFAFAYCYGLTSIVIPNSVTEIGKGAFEGCAGLTSIVIPNSVTAIGNFAFDCCYGLTSLNIGNSVTYIGNKAFENCSGLTSIVIPNSVTEIGDGAFKSCWGVTSLNIGNSVTYIGDGAFEGCAGLTSIVIPNSVTEIGEKAFEGCYGLTSIDIPNSVTEIGDRAFYSCYGLTSIVVGSGNPRYDSRNNCNAIIETASNTLLVGCRNTVIPNTVAVVGDYAFAYCADLTSIDIPNSVTKIGDGAFSCCKGLTSVDIPDSVTKIGIGAFEACTRLANIVIPNSVTSIGLSAFYNTVWYNNQPDGLVYAGMVAYEYKGTMPSGTNVTLKEGTLGIAGCAFESCTGLTSIVIPNSVIDIGDGAFYWCTGLTDVYCYIADPSRVSYGNEQFNLNDGDYSGRTLHVLKGKADAYGADENWYPYFGRIVEDLNPVIPSGDVNGDLEVNIADVNATVDIILNGGENPSGDVNDDGEINIADINAVIDIILGGTWN